MSSFNEDLEFGKIYEKKLVKLIKSWGLTEGEKVYKKKVYVKKGFFPYYDVYYSHYDITDTKVIKRYEVKADRKAYKYNSIYLENTYKGKPSGIQTTQADFYAYYIIKENKEEDLYIIPTSTLKQIINEEKYTTMKHNKTTTGYIISLDILNDFYYIK